MSNIILQQVFLMTNDNTPIHILNDVQNKIGTEFDQPTFLFSKHTDLSNLFNISNTNLHYMNVQWSITTNDNKNWLKEYNNFCVCMDEFYSIRVVESMSSNQNTRTTIYETIIYIHNNKLLKDMIVGIELPYIKTKLLFHLYWKDNHPLLRTHLSILSKIQQLFHQIIISVAFDRLDPNQYTVVQNYIHTFLPSNKTVILKTVNHKKAGESVSFYNLLQNISKQDEYVFYAHSKGLRHSHYDNVLLWVLMLYWHNISNFENMIYSNYTMGGCFISDTPFDLTLKNQWHYSGSFYWFNPNKHDSVITKTRVKDYYISEKFPSIYNPAQLKCAEFCNIPPNTFQDKCPLYNKNIYQIHFPYIFTIKDRIMSSLCKNHP